MAEEGGGGGTGSDVIFFLLVLAFLSVVFFVSGAAKRGNMPSLFIPFPGTGTSTFDAIGVPKVDYGNATNGAGGFDQSETNAITDEVAALQQDVAALRAVPNSPYADKVSLISAHADLGIRPEEEYVEIRASLSNTSGVSISGWRLVSAVSHRTVTIPTGVDVYLQGYGYSQSSPVTLQPGDSAIVTTGRSPVGASFRVNKCSGYLAQFQDFAPTLFTQCPRPQEELNNQSDHVLFGDNDCYNHLSSLPSCTIEVSPPPELAPACRDFIYTRLTYQGCISAHLSDKDFSRPEWRVFLGLPSTLWREKREALVLFDAEGKLVDSITY